LAEVVALGFGELYVAALAKDDRAYFAFEGALAARTIFFFVFLHDGRGIKAGSFPPAF
jgi:hypothetical protein